jgi:[acyl-carrier-protein] S-malonyltransferase
MTGTAYIFPGQGSQYVGMGKDLYEQSDVARKVFDEANRILGISLSKICFEGPEDELRQTRNTQPAIFLHSFALTRMMSLRDAAMTAGHSLGEYTALVFAGAMSFETGLKLVRLRGELMQRAGEEQHGTMAAVVGLDDATVEELCNEASTAGIVQAANFNSPGQIVISGTVAGVRKGMELAKARGAKLVKELVVSGAFHSPLMQQAREGLKAGLEAATIGDAKIPVVANVTARPVQRASEIRTLLEQQLTHAVRWEQSVSNMIAGGATSFVEIGPGKVLQGLVKRIDARVEVRGIDKFSDVQRLIPVSA